MMTTISTEAAEIIEELEAGHAATNAAGRGSPQLDVCHDFIVELIAEAPDPVSRLAEIVDVLARVRADHKGLA